MPTYDYCCARCGEMEIFQSIKDDALAACPECGSKRFQRQISGGAGVIFKGEGFYETDYNRSSDYAKAAKQEACGSDCACAPGTSSGTASTADGGSKKAAKPASKSATTTTSTTD